MKECSIADDYCGPGYYAKGLCKKHYDRKRRQENPQAGRDASKRARIKHPEKKKQRGRDWYSKNSEKVKAKAAAWKKANPERAKELNAQSRKRNIGTSQAARANRRAREVGALGATSPAEWQEILTHFKRKCVYCGIAQKRMHRDHVIPLSKGGTNWPQNLVPACFSCNPAKANSSLEEFYERCVRNGTSKHWNPEVKARLWNLFEAQALAPSTGHSPSRNPLKNQGQSTRLARGLSDYQRFTFRRVPPSSALTRPLPGPMNPWSLSC